MLGAFSGDFCCLHAELLIAFLKLYNFDFSETMLIQVPSHLWNNFAHGYVWHETLVDFCGDLMGQNGFCSKPYIITAPYTVYV